MVFGLVCDLILFVVDKVNDDDDDYNVEENFLQENGRFI